MPSTSRARDIENKFSFESLFIAAVLVVGLCGPSSAQQSMEEALAAQGALLDRVERGASDVPQPDAAAGNSGPDSRRAASAPEDRVLPREIFDERKVRIEAGRWDNRADLRLHELVLDADQDGQPELVRWLDVESELLVREIADSDYDGVIDTWQRYEWGVLLTRSLDVNNDGRRDTWERYAEGRMTSREVDRNDDGTRDAFFRYEHGELVEETHDADDDGRIDLRIEYRGLRRTRSEEDYDKDGRMDIWTRYALHAGREIAVRIERDRLGQGAANVFERFAPAEAGADATNDNVVLLRREEDLDGDGEIDVVSLFESGKLVRQEISDPKKLEAL